MVRALSIWDLLLERLFGRKVRVIYMEHNTSESIYQGFGEDYRMHVVPRKGEGFSPKTRKIFSQVKLEDQPQRWTVTSVEHELDLSTINVIPKNIKSHVCRGRP